MPDYERDPSAFFRSRDALPVVDQIAAPVLLLHGSTGRLTGANQPLRRWTWRAGCLGKTYGLVMYAGEDHELSRNRADCDQKALEWFAAHRRASSAPR